MHGHRLTATVCTILKQERTSLWFLGTQLTGNRHTLAHFEIILSAISQAEKIEPLSFQHISILPYNVLRLYGQCLHNLHYPDIKQI